MPKKRLAAIWASSLICLTLLAYQSLGQQAVARKSTTNQPKKEIEKSRNLHAVAMVKEFANRAFSFEDPARRILSVARFADLLWKEDESHARQLFARAVDLCTPKTDASQNEKNMLARLRREVIAIASSRDIGLAKQLTTDGENSSNIEIGATNIRVANRLLKTQPDQALNFAVRSLDSGVSMDLVFFLLRMREQNQQMANQFYHDVLNRLSSMNCIEPEALILLGTYVFTFRDYSSEPNVSPTTIRYIGFGSVMLPDISMERSELPRKLTLEYLEAAATVLSTPVCISQDRAQLYAASYLLLTKANRLAPHLALRIASSMQTVRDGVSPELRDDSTYKKFETNAVKTLDQRLAEIEGSAGVETRDAQYFALVFDLWRRSDFDNARIVNSRISDANIRERLSRLILFGEGAEIVKKETNADEAERIAGKLPAGTERALLRLGLASVYTGKRDLARAEESINASLRDARRLDDNRAGFLMLAAASELAGIHSPEAMTVLSESVRKLNAEKSNQEVRWEEKITCGVLWRDWPIEISRVNNTFNRALPRLMAVDADVTLEAILKITDERHLSEALLAVATIILQDNNDTRPEKN